jgi:hypothetical protein
MSIECDDCVEMGKIMVDGCDFGGRMLEDVTFYIEIDKDNYITDIYVDNQIRDWDSHPYLAQLNKDYFMNTLKGHLINADIVTCSQCKGEVDIYRKLKL